MIDCCIQRPSIKYLCTGRVILHGAHVCVCCVTRAYVLIGLPHSCTSDFNKIIPRYDTHHLHRFFVGIAMKRPNPGNKNNRGNGTRPKSSPWPPPWGSGRHSCTLQFTKTPDTAVEPRKLTLLHWELEISSGKVGFTQLKNWIWVSMPRAYKLDHLQPIQPTLIFPSFSLLYWVAFSYYPKGPIIGDSPNFSFG